MCTLQVGSPAASIIFAVEINLAIFGLHIFMTVVMCFVDVTKLANAFH